MPRKSLWVDVFGILVEEMEIDNTIKNVVYDEQLLKEAKIRKVQVTKSGESLLIRIPPEIAEFLNIHYKSLLQLFPVDKDRLEVKVVD